MNSIRGIAWQMAPFVQVLSIAAFNVPAGNFAGKEAFAGMPVLAPGQSLPDRWAGKAPRSIREPPILLSCAVPLCNQLRAGEWTS